MSPEIVAALQPDLQPLEGDGVVWGGKSGGTRQTIITWQGIQKNLTDWAMAFGMSENGFRYRLRRMPLHLAMDKSKTTKEHGEKIPRKKTVKKKYVQGVDYHILPPVESLL